MDSQNLGILTLLRSALNNERLTLPENFDWEAAAVTLYKHHMTGLGIQGAALCGVPRNHPVITKMTLEFCKQLQASRNQMRTLQQVYALFDANGIEYLPIKGAVIKPLYSKPEYRLMGDADILIHPEQYPKIREILTGAGMREAAETDYELVWKCPGLTLELHKRLIATHNEDYHAYYGDGWPAFIEKGPGCAYYLRREDHYIYLLVHFAKHYREGSISAKNICDFWVCRKAWPNMDEDYICSQLKKLKLLKFYRNMQDVLDAWFCGGEFTPAAELITQVAFRGAIYTAEESEMVSSMIKLNKQNGSVTKSKFHWFFRRIFPPREIMECSHPTLKKFPVLLPFFWIWRLVRMLLRDPRRVRKGLSNTREVSQVSDEQLVYYEEQLHAVGLDFNFTE